MADFYSVVHRLQWILERADEYLSEKGVDCSNAHTMLDYVNLICEVPNDIVHVRNGRELFLNNIHLEQFPELIDCGSFTSCYKMCYGCTCLETVPWLNTHNVTDFIYAFYGCTNLAYIEHIDTSAATSVGEMFHGCKSLVTIDSPLDFSNVTSQCDTTFTTCSALQNLTFEGTINVDIWINGCTKLTVASLLSVLNALADLTGTGLSRRITLGSRNTSKLTAAQLAIATDKGWILG